MLFAQLKIYIPDLTLSHIDQLQDFESLNILDIRLWEVGAKRRLNGTSKVNTQTDSRTDISTCRKHRPTGPML